MDLRNKYNFVIFYNFKNYLMVCKLSSVKKNNMYIAFFLTVLLPSVMSLDPSCLVFTTTSTGTVNFNFQHKTTINTGTDTFTKIQRNNDLYFQIVKYSNDKYGHYVSFNDYNQTRFFRNNTVTSIVYSGVYCASPSYRPKELSQLWVKNFTGEEPLVMSDNENVKFFTASVTLKCQGVYCNSYNFETQQYTDCTDTTYFPTTVGIKANFSVAPLPSSSTYDSTCSYSYTYTNDTTSCTQPYAYGYGYDYRALNTTLHNVAFNSKPYRVKSLLRMNYLQSSYGTINNNTQYYSVCGEECYLLPIA